MARFETIGGRIIGRLAACLALAAMTSGAAAQISDQDRLSRCENNRARMLEIQAAWPRGPRGWSDEQLARARRAMPTFRIYHDRAFRLSGDAQREDRMTVVRDMAQLAAQFGVICFPLGPECSSSLLDSMERGLVDAEEAASERTALLEQFNRYRSNYIALNCTAGAASSLSGSDLGFAIMTGTFDSNFGLLTLSTGGGSYDYYGGQLRVSGISGNVMEGTWTQTRSGRQCPDGLYRGRFRFTFTSSGFSGSFGYCEDEPGAGVWNGTRR
jgi:hypothetical protein